MKDRAADFFALLGTASHTCELKSKFEKDPPPLKKIKN